MLFRQRARRAGHCSLDHWFGDKKSTINICAARRGSVFFRQCAALVCVRFRGACGATLAGRLGPVGASPLPNLERSHGRIARRVKADWTEPRRIRFGRKRGGQRCAVGRLRFANRRSEHRQGGGCRR